MKTIIYGIYLALLAVYFTLPAGAQNSQTAQQQTLTQSVIYDRQISVKIINLRQSKDSVQAILDFDFSKISVASKHSMTLTPVIVGTQGRAYRMKNIVINGKQQQKVFMRRISVNGLEKQMRDTHFAVITLDGSNNTFRYRQSIPFESWMRDARMDIITERSECGSEPEQYASEKVATRIILDGARAYGVLPNVAYIRPSAEAVKSRSQSNNVFLDFPSGQTNINPSYGNNPRELGKVEKIVKDIQKDKNVQVRTITITGYASPDGDVNLNNNLARGRAQALSNFMSMTSGVNPGVYRLGSGGEDWEGLTKALQKTNIEPKQQIVSIIRYFNPTERKTRLKALNGGQVWQRMAAELFPQLRRVESKIDYTVKSFNVDEAKEIIKTRPQQLSLNEMYLLANTYEEGGKDFESVFDTMVRVFPNDPIANLNAGAVALLKKDFKKAEAYLQKSQRTTPAYFNNMGVLYLLQNNLVRAKGFFDRALEVNPGMEVAKMNLEEIKKKQEADTQLTN